MPRGNPHLKGVCTIEGDSHDQCVHWSRNDQCLKGILTAAMQAQNGPLLSNS